MCACRSPDHLGLRYFGGLQRPLDSHVYALTVCMVWVTLGWQSGGICQLAHPSPRVYSEGACGTQKIGDSWKRPPWTVLTETVLRRDLQEFLQGVYSSLNFINLPNKVHHSYCSCALFIS